MGPSSRAVATVVVAAVVTDAPSLRTLQYARLTHVSCDALAHIYARFRFHATRLPARP